MNRLIIFVKAPEPGRVKTRLMPFLSPTETAALYRAFIRDTVATAAGLPGVDVSIGYTPDGAQETLRSLVAQERIDWFPQTGETLGDRMWCAFQRAFRRGAHRAVIIGSDSPAMPGSLLAGAFEALTRQDMALGPAADGGYYLIGLTNRGAGNAVYRILFENMAWSTETVYAKTLERIQKAGLTCARLSKWPDVDQPEDLAALADHIRELRAAGDTFTAVHTERTLKTLRAKMAMVK